MRSIESYYIHTFYSTMTGPEFCTDNWRKADNSEVKFFVFTNHKSYFEAINPELKIWLAENWEDWTRDKPAWFTQSAIDTIPYAILPDAERRKRTNQDDKVIDDVGVLRESLRVSMRGR